MKQRRTYHGLMYAVVLMILAVVSVPGAFADVIIDNGDPGTSSTGVWAVSGGANPYGANSLWARNGATYTWQMTAQPAGTYEVYMWWSGWPSRATNIAVDISHQGGTAPLSVNQQQDAGQWNSLGQYYFNGTGSVRITAANGSTVSTCADAVWFRLVSANAPPVAVIDSISPSPAGSGETVTFTGHGTDSDGTIAAYQWESGINGTLSTNASFATSTLSAGMHAITFRVQDSNGVWSEPATASLTVGTIPAEVIIDNRDASTSSTGTWGVSGASGFYGTDSVWSRDGTTFSWNFSPPQTGSYQVSMWWTVWPSRSTSVPVRIPYAGGSTTVSVNQQVNGGRWNVLGEYFFEYGSTYAITVTSQPGPSSTCADAVKFNLVTSNTAPVATIDSAGPAPALYRQTVAFSGHGTDDGSITEYSWRSSIDGPLSALASFSTSDLTAGTHTIYFKVKDNSDTWSPEVSTTVDVQEHLYACLLYNWEDSKPRITSTLRNLGATEQSANVWRYRDNSRNRTFLIYIVQDLPGMSQALQRPGSHILATGHSNYGLGPSFANATELRNQVIPDIYFIDDVRILNLSSPWIHVSISGMRTGQAYPFWWPEFQDGTSGIMPYDFGDPRGNPAYNYAISYQVPGDPAWYKVSTVRNSEVIRFPDSYSTPWFSATGAEPNPSNPGHLQYFITNPAPWYPSFEATGAWTASQGVAGYFKEDYIYTPAGGGENQALWYFTIPQPGTYSVLAWWTASSARTSAAPFTVSHALGDTTVWKDQRINGSRWNELGQFSFDADDYSVLLTNQANPGNVVADAVRISHVDNPAEVIQSDFYASIRSGVAPLAVTFSSAGTGDITGWSWNFGDGSSNNTRDYIDHTYTSPGTYAVSLTVSGPVGSHTRTKTGYIVVGNATPPLQAEFSASSRIGAVPLSARFRDRSTGSITSWLWNFGDGTTSSEQNPTHLYAAPGNYTVSLKITDTNGVTRTETKPNFVRVVVFEKSIDNVDYPKTHYRSKTILFRRDLEIPKENLRFERALLDTCNSGNYYLNTYNRGIVFYTLNLSDGRGILLYLQSYLQGRTDEEIWQILQAYQPVYDYYNFNKKPTEQ